MKLQGLVAATYTPYSPDGSVNLDLIPRMTESMIDRGVAGFYVCGSTGEGESLSIEERKSVASAFVSAAGGRIPVVIQVGHNSIPSACELARHAAECGADAISTLPPTYFKPPTLELLIDSIATIAESAPKLPYYYYHIPRLSGVSFDTVKLLEAAKERIPSFNGIKFSDFFLAEMMACQEFDNGRYDILFGSDEMILGALATGAQGAVGSCYGFAAPLWNQIIAHYKQRNLEMAQAWMRKAARLVRILASDPGPFQACVKQVVWPLLDIDPGPCRLPQPALTEKQVQQARTSLEESGFAEEIKTGNFQLP
ncbi:MAG: dihydrodipicolinate synthase family protein [Verrucomicrobiales bacterium]|nr:dihydrodipicolinate synthase family protein [Verrucomicrobiales bacterium]